MTIPNIQEYYSVTNDLGISKKMSTNLLSRNYYSEDKSSSEFYSLRFAILETSKLGLELTVKNVEKQMQSYELKNQESVSLGVKFGSLLLAF